MEITIFRYRTTCLHDTKTNAGVSSNSDRTHTEMLYWVLSHILAITTTEQYVLKYFIVATSLKYKINNQTKEVITQCDVG